MMSPDESTLYFNLDQDETSSLFSEMQLPSQSSANSHKSPQHTNCNIPTTCSNEFGIEPSILTEVTGDSFNSTVCEAPFRDGSSESNYNAADDILLGKPKDKLSKETKKKMTLERNRVAAKNSRLKKKIWYSNLTLNLKLIKLKNEEKRLMNANLMNSLLNVKSELLKTHPECEGLDDLIADIKIPDPLPHPELPSSINWNEVNAATDQTEDP